MSRQIARCPPCHHRSVRLVSQSKSCAGKAWKWLVWRCECYNCEYLGPEESSREAARIAWGFVPREATK